MSALERIFEQKRAEVAAERNSIPLVEIRAQAEAALPARGFRRALETAPRDIALIAEVKKASPSKGLIRSDFDPALIAQTYEVSGASALSVLTDRDFFQGAPEYLSLAREATVLPVLRKDFIYDPYQVYQSRVWGADAILLIVAALDKSALFDLYKLASDLHMDVLAEVHTEDEADRALSVGFGLIGVNNRDLDDFKVDLNTSERILPMLTGHCTPVSESAIETYEDVVRVKAAGAKAVLIGTTFCAASDIGAKVKEVMAW